MRSGTGLGYSKRADCGVRCEDGTGRGEGVGVEDGDRAGLAADAGTGLTGVPRTDGLSVLKAAGLRSLTQQR